jgi:mycofactocin precursor
MAADDTQHADSAEGAGDAEQAEELLVEEISIDGMCGVY